MIELPRRSVTRFFIPLVDVLTLLFCVFLILQAARPADEGEGPGEQPGTDPASLKEARAESDRLRKELDLEKKQLEQLRKEKLATLHQRLTIRVLEIDVDTGKLTVHGPEPVEIKSEEEAAALIRKHKQEAGNRELYYLFLFSRPGRLVPQERIDQYERWFAGVAHGYDVPQS